MELGPQGAWGKMPKGKPISREAQIPKGPR
jgi:hypothetical protein